jgi:hypothetical protein
LVLVWLKLLVLVWLKLLVLVWLKLLCVCVPAVCELTKTGQEKNLNSHVTPLKNASDPKNFSARRDFANKTRRFLCCPANAALMRAFH